MSPEGIALLMLTTAIIGIMLGYPIAFVLGGLSALIGTIFVGPAIGNIFMLRLYGTLQDYVLIAIPLFVFMGIMLEETGIAAQMYHSVRKLMGRLPGGLALATIATGTIFAAATGVVGASVVTIGLVSLPAMLSYRYDKGLASGVICAAGTLGILIPPSIMIVVYGPMAALSVGQLFMATIGPGLLLSALYMLYVGIRCGLNPKLGPPMSPEELTEPFSVRLKQFVVAAAPTGLVILAVLGSIFFGVAAPTEAAGVGAFASMLLAAGYRKLSFQMLKNAALQTLRVTSMIYLVTIAAGFFTAVFLRLGGGRAVQQLALNLPFSPTTVILLMLGVVFIMGMFIDWIGIVMITVPIFTPIAKALGFDPLWFATLMIVVLQLGYLTPPFALAVFYLKGITPPDVTTADVYRGVVPFVIIQVIAIALIMRFPQIVLWLPRAMFS